LIDPLWFWGAMLIWLAFKNKAALRKNSSIYDKKEPTGSFQSPLGSGTSVVQVSIAMNVAHRDAESSILSILDRTADAADTSSNRGLQQLTSNVCLELLWKKSTFTAASISFQNYNDIDPALREYEKMAIQERVKFEEETRFNYGTFDFLLNFRKKQKVNDYGDNATMAVVTILMVIDGDSLMKKKEPRDLLQSMERDATVEDCLQSVEILWTPEERSETLTPEDVAADYPDLKAIV